MGVTGEGVSPLLSPSRNEKTKKCLASGTNDCKHELIDAKNLKNKKRRCSMQALKIATIIFNIAMLLWMIVLDCKEKNTGTSVGFKILSLGFGGTIVYLIMN